MLAPGGRDRNQRHWRVLKQLEAGLVELRFGLHRRPHHGAGQAQSLGVLLLGAAAQGQQRQRGLVYRHHLALGGQQGLDLVAQRGESRILEPALAGLEQHGGEGAALNAGGQR